MGVGRFLHQGDLGSSCTFRIFKKQNTKKSTRSIVSRGGWGGRTHVRVKLKLAAHSRQARRKQPASGTASHPPRSCLSTGTLIFDSISHHAIKFFGDFVFFFGSVATYSRCRGGETKRGRDHSTSNSVICLGPLLTCHRRNHSAPGEVALPWAAATASLRVFALLADMLRFKDDFCVEQQIVAMDYLLSTGGVTDRAAVVLYLSSYSGPKHFYCCS